MASRNDLVTIGTTHAILIIFSSLYGQSHRYPREWHEGRDSRNLYFSLMASGTDLVTIGTTHAILNICLSFMASRTDLVTNGTTHAILVISITTPWPIAPFLMRVARRTRFS